MRRVAVVCIDDDDVVGLEVFDGLADLIADGTGVRLTVGNKK